MFTVSPWWQRLAAAAVLVGGVAVADGAAQTVTWSVAAAATLAEASGNHNGERTADCDGAGVLLSGLSCYYTVATGDLDVDGVVRVPAGGSTAVGMRDSSGQAATLPLTPAAPRDLGGLPPVSGGDRTIQFYPELSVEESTASEDAGPVTFTVTLAPASVHQVTVRYATSDGTTSPADYTAAGSTLTFAPGETTKAIEVAVVDDAADAADEEFTLTLSGPVRAGFAAGGSTVAATGRIDDDDPAVEVSFAETAYIAEEGGSPATVTVSLNVDPEREVVIPLRATPRNGAVAADYSGVPEEVRFTSDGVLSRTFTLTAVDDAIDDDGETVAFGFGTLPERVSAGSPQTATVELVDDDVRGVEVSPTFLAIPEGEPGQYTVVLTSQPTADVTVAVIIPGGSPLTLTFTPDDWETPKLVRPGGPRCFVRNP